MLESGTPLILEYIKRLKIARESHVLDLAGFGMRAIPVEVSPNPEK